MLRFKLKFDKFEFDPKLFKAASDAWMKYEITEASRIFFKAALPLIRIDTGMSIASFTNLARFLNEPLAYQPRRGTIDGGYRPPNSSTVLDRGPYNGEMMATASSEIIRQVNGKWSFQYWTEVWQFVIGDIFGLKEGKPPTPWGAFEEGKSAALAYLRTSGDRMPPLDVLMAVTEVAILVQDGVSRTNYRKRNQVTSRNLFKGRLSKRQ